MARKISENFLFQYALKHKVVEEQKIVTRIEGYLTVTGTAYFDPSVSVLDTQGERYTVDIDFVKFNGTDIKPVLEVFGNLDEIEEAAIKMAANKIFNQIAA